MIAFDKFDFIFSALSALIYGAFFAFFACMLKVVFYSFKKFLYSIYKGFFYNGKILDMTELKNIKYENEKNVASVNAEIIRSLSVILYSLGLMIVSYYALDGQFRLYILILSLCGLYIFFKYPIRFTEKIIVRLIDLLICAFTLIIRIVFYPIKSIFIFLYLKFVKNGCISRNFHVFCSNLSLDNADKK